MRKKTSVILLPVIFLLCHFSYTAALAYAPGDTLKAHNFAQLANQLMDSASYDSSVFYYNLAAHEYKKAKQWEKYFQCSNNSIAAAKNVNPDQYLLDQASNLLSESRKRFGEENTITGTAYNLLGSLHSDRNEEDTALYYYRKAVACWEASPDCPQEKIADVYHNISGAYVGLGKYDSAKVYVNKALEIYLSLHGENYKVVASCYNNMGIMAYHMGAMHDCEDYFTKATKINENIYGLDHPYTAEAYNNLASLYQRMGRFNDALTFHLKAYDIRIKKFGLMHPMTALSLNNIGNTYDYLGEWEKALDFHLRALEIRKEILDSLHSDLSMSYTNLGILYRNMGLFQQSLDYFQKALHIQVLNFGPENPYTANAYNNMGAIYASLGNYDMSLSYFKKALEMRRRKGEYTPYVAGSYNNIGTIYKYKGDYELALAYYNRSIEIKKHIFGNAHPEIASSIDNIGEVMLIREQPDSAKNCFEKSLQMQKQFYGDDNPELITSYLNLGAAYAKLDDYDAEYKCYLRGLNLSITNYGSNSEETSHLYGNISTNFMDRGFPDSAFFYHRLSIDIMKKIYPANHPNLVSSYSSFAELFNAHGDLDSARHYYLMALQTNYKNNLTLNQLDFNDVINEEDFIENLLNLVNTDYELFDKQKKTDYLNEVIACFEDIRYLVPVILSGFTVEETKVALVNMVSGESQSAVDAAFRLYKKTGDEAFLYKAFEFAELTKATVLQDVIGKCDAEVRSDVPADLLQDKQSTLGYLGYLSTKLKKNQYDNDIQRKSDEQKTDSLIVRLKEIREDIDRYIAKNEFIFLPELKTILPRIKEKLTDEAAILSYFIADSSVFCFAISRDTMNVIKTKVNQNMEELIHNYLGSLKKFETENYLNYSNILYNILISPGMEFLKGKKKIVILPDKDLLFLPFETLTAADEIKDGFAGFQSIDYLISAYEISYHYNLGLWMNEKTSEGNTPVSFLGFAPVFSENKDHSPTPDNSLNILSGIKNEEILRSVSIDGQQFNTLPYTKFEIDTLQSLFESGGYKTESFFYQNASEANFRHEAPNYKFIHIASHGIVDNKNAELTGIVFAPPAEQLKITSLNDTVSMQNNGILYSRELYTMNIPADLVVLSACETGLGKFEKGEGIMGLTRGFLYAGVSNIVYSFWKVGDKSTLQFMTSFYKNILDNKSYSSALREAKLEMIRDPSTAYPLFWGSFALIGN